jgi:hypothetical protein
MKVGSWLSVHSGHEQEPYHQVGRIIIRGGNREGKYEEIAHLIGGPAINNQSHKNTHTLRQWVD